MRPVMNPIPSNSFCTHIFLIKFTVKRRQILIKQVEKKNRVSDHSYLSALLYFVMQGLWIRLIHIVSEIKGSITLIKIGIRLIWNCGQCQILHSAADFVPFGVVLGHALHLLPWLFALWEFLSFPRITSDGNENGQWESRLERRRKQDRMTYICFSWQ